MVPGDITIYTDHFGARHVAVILKQNENGTYQLSVLKPTHHEVEAKAAPGIKGYVFDPTLAENEAEPKTQSGVTQLQSVPEGDDGGGPEPA